MTINDAGIKLIKSFEGCRLSVYLDVGGLPTVGWGQRTDLSVGTEITQDEADKMLLDALGEVQRGINQLVKTSPSSNQYSALVAFTYNVGLGNFKQSTLLRCVNNNNWTDASKAFAPWCKVQGKVVDGLVRRRAAESALFMAPDS